MYNSALRLFYKREFENAARHLVRAQELIPEDKNVQRFLERCELYQKYPPPEDWTGAVTFTEK